MRLPDLVAHEEQLLARMRPHESEIGAQIGELLPRIAGGAPISEYLPCTTSSWESGRMNFSENA